MTFPHFNITATGLSYSLLPSYSASPCASYYSSYYSSSHSNSNMRLTCSPCSATNIGSSYSSLLNHHYQA
jgi:hypothetical protein